MAKMIQQVMTNPKEIVFKQVDIPTVGDDDVLIKIKMIGICGSDIHVYHGLHPFTKYPVTQGHEVSGEVVEVGKNVKSVKPGDKVTIEPQVRCGKCYPCRNGKYNLCESLKVMGFQTTGAASEYFKAPEINVTKLPDDMDYKKGAMIEPLAVAVHAISRVGDVNGLNISVIGAGPIGNLVAQTAKALGANVMLSDISDYRLTLGKKTGIEHVYNTKNMDYNDALIDCFGPDKADVIYDCAGNDITMNSAIRSARKGSTIILVAVYAGMANVDLAVLNDHELDLNTTMMYRHEDYLKAIELVNDKKINLEALQSNVFPFKDYLKAYEFIDANRETSMKVLIDLEC